MGTFAREAGISDRKCWLTETGGPQHVHVGPAAGAAVGEFAVDHHGGHRTDTERRGPFTVTSQEGQAISRICATAASQAGHPALKISIVRFVVIESSPLSGVGVSGHRPRLPGPP